MFGMNFINIQSCILFEIVVEVVPWQFLVVKMWTTFEINIAFQRFHIILLLHMMNTTQLYTQSLISQLLTQKVCPATLKCGDSLCRDAATIASNSNAHVISDCSTND